MVGNLAVVEQEMEVMVVVTMGVVAKETAAKKA